MSITKREEGWRLLDYGEEPPEGMEWEQTYVVEGGWKWSPCNRPRSTTDDNVLVIYRYRPAKTDADKCWESFGVGLYNGSRKKGKYSFDRTSFDEVAAHIRKWDKDLGLHPDYPKGYVEDVTKEKEE